MNKSRPLFHPGPAYMSDPRMWFARFIEGAPAGTETPPAPPAAPAETPPVAPDESKLGDGGLAALAAERQSAKDAKAALTTAQAELQKYKDAEKTAEERAADRLSAAEKVASESTRKAQQYEAAAAAGLPLSAASRISGATAEEMAADATALKALIGNGKPADILPPPDPSQGNGGGGAKPASLNDAIKGHYA